MMNLLRPKKRTLADAERDIERLKAQLVVKGVLIIVAAAIFMRNARPR